MPTNAQQVKIYLDFALVQLAAESYWQGVDFALLSANDVDEEAIAIRRLKYGFNDPTHPFIAKKAGMLDENGQSQADTANETPTTGSNSPVLLAYNRMVATQANAFLNDYEIIDHHANDVTGLAVTLFRKKGTEEYILSPRSTEFRDWSDAGDGERDQTGANLEGIGLSGEVVSFV